MADITEQEEFEFRLRAEQEAQQQSVTAPESSTRVSEKPESTPKTERKKLSYMESLQKVAPALLQSVVSVGSLAAKAVGEPVLSLASGLAAKPASEIAGLSATGYEMAAGGEGAQNIPGFKQEVQERLTYEPRSAAGRSPYNPLAAIPKMVGKAVEAVTPEKAAPGEATTLEGALRNIASEAVPQAIGFAGVKGAPKTAVPAQKVAKTLRAKAEDLMQSALKPTMKDLKNGNAAVAIDTMLEKGINVTPKGIEQIRARIDDLNGQIKDMIANSPEKVTTARIARPVVEKLKQFRNQVNPAADINALKKSWTEFKNHPFVRKDELSVQAAQELKQGTYKQLSKKYGQAGTAEVETQKTIARGLKEQIAEKVPKIAGLNAEESRFLKTLSVAERRILMEANKNPMGLSLLAKNPAAWAAFMTDRSAAMKSILARIMNRTSQKLSGKGRGAEKATTIASAIAPTQADKEKRANQYRMEEFRNR